MILGSLVLVGGFTAAMIGLGSQPARPRAVLGGLVVMGCGLVMMIADG